MEKVLIIEDNTMMRLFLANYLSGEYEVVTALNPMEGKEIIAERANEFSLVISDYYTAQSQEAKALESMKLSLQWQSIPLIVLTDEDKSEQRISAFEIGATDCLSKPFNPKELTMRMKGLIKSIAQPLAYRPVA